MSHVRTQISFKGFTESEVREGIPHLKKIFRNRPWLLKTRAIWDKRRKCLVVVVEAERLKPVVASDDDPAEIVLNLDSATNWEEVNECVDACFKMSADEVVATVDTSVLVDPNKARHRSNHVKNLNPRRKDLRRSRASIPAPAPQGSGAHGRCDRAQGW